MGAHRTQWHDFGALADVTLVASAVASRVPTLFVLQDQVVWSAWVCKDIREDQFTTLQKLPGLDNLTRDMWRRSREELIAHVTEDNSRCRQC